MTYGGDVSFRIGGGRNKELVLGGDKCVLHYYNTSFLIYGNVGIYIIFDTYFGTFSKSKPRRLITESIEMHWLIIGFGGAYNEPKICMHWFAKKFFSLGS